MRPIDRRVLEAALEGSLSLDDAADLIQLIIEAYPAEEARRLVRGIRSYDSELDASGPPPVGLLEHTEARQFVVASVLDSMDEIGTELLSWRSASAHFERVGVVDPEDSVDAARRSSELIGLVLDGEFLFPSFQFDGDREGVRSAVKDVNRMMGAVSDPWGTAAWWVQIDGRVSRRPAEMLSSTPLARQLVALASGSVELSR